jgi:transposase InsO family protein
MAAKRNRKRLSPRSLRRVHIAARSANLTAADRDLLAVPKADWAFEKRQERIVKSALRVGAMEAARSTGCSKRTIYRLLASYRMNPTLLAFLPRRRAPSATSVAMALRMACLPKSKWLNALEIEADWPMYGIPEVLDLDNASEFHSEALRRGCERYGIRLDYRPPGQPYTGGHIERYLGTLMRRIHGVPGTTMSNVKERGTYKSEKHASLSLRELESWLTMEDHGWPNIRYYSRIGVVSRRGSTLQM